MAFGGAKGSAWFVFQVRSYCSMSGIYGIWLAGAVQRAVLDVLCVGVQRTLIAFACSLIY